MPKLASLQLPENVREPLMIWLDMNATPGPIRWTWDIGQIRFFFQDGDPAKDTLTEIWLIEEFNTDVVTNRLAYEATQFFKRYGKEGIDASSIADDLLKTFTMIDPHYIEGWTEWLKK